MEEEPSANSTCAQEQPDDKTPPSKPQDPTEGQQDDDGFELVTNKRQKNKNKQQSDKPPVQRYICRTVYRPIQVLFFFLYNSQCI